MKTLTYLFWRFWKFRVRKDSGDKNSAYFFVSGFFSIFLVGVSLMIIVNNFFLISDPLDLGFEPSMGGPGGAAVAQPYNFIPVNFSIQYSNPGYPVNR